MGIKLEQLERLRSEDTPRHPMITHTSDSHQIPKSKQDKVNVTNLKKLQKIQIFKISHKTLDATHLLKLIDKIYNYEMDPTRTVGSTEGTRDAGRMDGRTDGQTDGRTEWNQYTPQQLHCVEGIIISSQTVQQMYRF